MINGTWCISEIHQAVKDGYKIQDVTQLLIYPHQEKIFSDFIAKFHTLKQQYSGIPKNVQNKRKFAEDLSRYMLNEFGIYMKPSEINPDRNDGMRLVMKLMQNYGSH